MNHVVNLSRRELDVLLRAIKVYKRTAATIGEVDERAAIASKLEEVRENGEA